MGEAIGVLRVFAKNNCVAGAAMRQRQQITLQDAEVALEFADAAEPIGDDIRTQRRPERLRCRGQIRKQAV